MMHTFVIISAELAGLTAAENARRSKQLRERLSEEWMGTFPVSGCYKGTRERSFLVPLLPYDLEPAHKAPQLLRLRAIAAREYDQESILYVDARLWARLIMCSAKEVIDLGRWVETDRATAEARDSYTTYTSGITCSARYFVTDAPTITYAEAQARYRAGDYAFKAPPVSPSRWTEADWIFYVLGVRP